MSDAAARLKEWGEATRELRCFAAQFVVAVAENDTPRRAKLPARKELTPEALSEIDRIGTLVHRKWVAYQQAIARELEGVNGRNGD